MTQTNAPGEESAISNSVRAAQILFYLNAAIWFLFGSISLTRFPLKLSQPATASPIVAILMFANAGMMVLCGLLLAKQRKLFLYLAVGWLAVNILLTVPDQIGVFDLITLIMDIILLAILFLTRWSYTKP